MIQTIHTYPDPILTTTAEKVRDFNAPLKELADAMIEMMRQANGMGLAAPQIGKNIRLVVIEYRPEPNDDQDEAIPLQVLINPKVISTSRETDVIEEGCLSLPGIEVPVERPIKVKIRAQDLDGKPLQFRANNLHARIVQHEIDHLDGRLIWDHSKDRARFLRAYNERKNNSVTL